MMEARSFSKVRIFVAFCSSVGQNLKTSTYVGEIFFAIFIATFGLVLFALLIGNMQVNLGQDYEMRS